jgi:hypothetical protein
MMKARESYARVLLIIRLSIWEPIVMCILLGVAYEREHRHRTSAGSSRFRHFMWFVYERHNTGQV